MGVFVAILLVLVAVGLFVATHRGYIANTTLESLANIASVVALLAAIAVFVVPAATSDSSQTPAAGAPVVAPAPTTAPAPATMAPADNTLADTPQPAAADQPQIVMLREDVFDGAPNREDFSVIITEETILPRKYESLDGIEIQVYSGTGEVLFELFDGNDNFLSSLGPEPLQTTPMRRLGIQEGNYVRVRITPTQNQTAAISVIVSLATDITLPGLAGDP